MEKMNETILRPLNHRDQDELQSVRAAAFAPVFEGFRRAVGERIAKVAFRDAERDQAKHLDALCSPGSGAEIAVAEKGGRVIGFVTWRVSGDTGEIDLNAVHPDFAGNGIGSRLYAYALRAMRARGVRVVEVSTGGDETHAPARQAYFKAGFRAAIPSVALYLDLDEAG